MSKPLQACLDYSKELVMARMRNNHNNVNRSMKGDIEIIGEVGRIMEIKNIINKIRKHEKNKTKNT